MTPQTFMFFGPAGSGKGTQAKLLVQTLERKDPLRKVLYVETGQKFREFAEEASWTAEKVKEILDTGGLMPEFLPVWIWTTYFVKHISGNEHIVLDGVSRRPHEALIIDSAMKFYERKEPTVISIKVSPEWAIDKLGKRGREDDTEMEIKKRLDWYEANVVPALEYFKNNSYYKCISINGEQTIEEVHKEILEKIKITS